TRFLKNPDDACDGIVPVAAVVLPTRLNLALLALSEMGADARPAIPAILQLVKNTDPIEVFDCLAHLGAHAHDALPTLQMLMDECKGYDRLLAAATILCLDADNSKALDLLVGALKHDDADTRNQALNACARYGPKIKALVPLLVAALKDEYSPGETSLFSPM